jgi:hypothetical protein
MGDNNDSEAGVVYRGVTVYWGVGVVGVWDDRWDYLMR